MENSDIIINSVFLRRNHYIPSGLDLTSFLVRPQSGYLLVKESLGSSTECRYCGVREFWRALRLFQLDLLSPSQLQPGWVCLPL